MLFILYTKYTCWKTTRYCFSCECGHTSEWGFCYLIVLNQHQIANNNNSSSLLPACGDNIGSDEHYHTTHHLDTTCMFQQNFYDYSSWNVFLWPFLFSRFVFFFLYFCFCFNADPILLQLQQILWWQYYLYFEIIVVLFLWYKSLKSCSKRTAIEYCSSHHTAQSHKWFRKHKIIQLFLTY